MDRSAIIGLGMAAAATAYVGWLWWNISQSKDEDQETRTTPRLSSSDRASVSSATTNGNNDNPFQEPIVQNTEQDSDPQVDPEMDAIPMDPSDQADPLPLGLSTPAVDAPQTRNPFDSDLDLDAADSSFFIPELRETPATPKEKKIRDIFDTPESTPSDSSFGMSTPMNGNGNAGGGGDGMTLMYNSYASPQSTQMRLDMYRNRGKRRPHTTKTHKKKKRTYQDDEDPFSYPEQRTLWFGQDQSFVYKVGVCVMAKKAKSPSMKAIIEGIEKSSRMECFVFPEEMILEQDILTWPVCDVLIAFFSNGYPLDKVIAYHEMYRDQGMISVNNLPRQKWLWNRAFVYQMLENAGVPIPEYVLLDHLDETVQENLQEYPDCLVFENRTIQKPFVEKPVDGDDHNLIIYYPESQGGGSRRLFRKTQNKSSEFFPNENSVRRDGKYLYEKFYPTQKSADVKMYAVGKEYLWSESRKSPVVDGIVQRDSKTGKEVRYRVEPTEQELEFVPQIYAAFRQFVCGFDVLRTEDGQSLVCDVNGWSFVKNQPEYFENCADILVANVLQQLGRRKPLHYQDSVSGSKFQKSLTSTTTTSSSSSSSSSSKTLRYISFHIPKDLQENPFLDPNGFYNGNTDQPLEKVEHEVKQFNVKDRMDLYDNGFTIMNLDQSLIEKLSMFGNEWPGEQVKQSIIDSLMELTESFLFHTYGKSVTIRAINMVGRGDSEKFKPILVTHVDFPEKIPLWDLGQSFGWSVADELGKEALSGPEADMINIWIPMRSYMDSPLLLIDSGTVSESDLLEYTAPRQSGDRFRSVAVKDNPKHKWYIPNLQEGCQALIFRTLQTPHACTDLSESQEKSKRYSLEFRCFVVAKK